MRPTAVAMTRNNHRERSKITLVMRLFAFMVGVTVCFLCLSASAQEKDSENKLRTETIKTKDGVKLRAFYMPSSKGKEAIPVLIIHEWGGQASPYAKLVLALSKAGCAVIVPDYRGHGGSKEYTAPNGKTEKFDIDTMRKDDIANIINRDMEAVKKFLIQENNDGKLNLNALVVIGVREGGIIGSHWAASDWQWGPVGAKKRGQDVKALVLVSPEKVLKGVPIDLPLRNPAILSLPIMVLDGTQSPNVAEAKRVAKRIEAVKKRMGKGTAEGLATGLVRTSLTGLPLLNETKPAIPGIVKFIQDHVEVTDDENIWIERK